VFPNVFHVIFYYVLNLFLKFPITSHFIAYFLPKVLLLLTPRIEDYMDRILGAWESWDYLVMSGSILGVPLK
jgi:hypothetical protein